MTQESHFISPQISLSELVHTIILVTSQRYFVVTDGAQWQGVLTLRSLKAVPRKKWDSTPIGEVMTPASQVRPVRVEQSAVSLLEQMDDSGIDEVPVMEADRVVGIISRDSLRQLARTRRELRI
jgi:CBS domain-containing protein